MENLTYAIGDIHGCRAELQRLLSAIDDHAAGQPYEIVFVGDYVDKGPDSAGVIEALMRLQAKASSRVICLKGNHDAQMAAAASSEAAAAKWMTMSGGPVLAQYGVRRARDLPKDILTWLDALPTWHEDAQRHFVHAGIDPSRRRDDQDDAVRMSMRGVFLERDFDFGRHVVHGHTPQLGGLPDQRAFRTNLDTGVVDTGRLTAAMFDASTGPPLAILSARRKGTVQVQRGARRPITA